ncbi:23S rRNA (adenine(1618)-N(6))-methyltransferase RlmF [Neptunomonas qingdaonensis]|uniref:Ribosomal RNA large subunit methyltransferase F n=1 Tax=Neptunomonas qingdaonensis TaxID=1045558 RepID=A0A1I2P9U5_9GAMM|nr:23S rRNA (adenine(1618)-N(6))-methyltransferase RlmF [Neptunomonas qingdaonensis]SFG12273.1 23S rRNA (adenine1618-N6)-methyltransferase [Neptunomonas qingdaonensis]
MSVKLHPRNLHQGRYDLSALSLTCPELNTFLRPNPKGDQTIDFSDDKAVVCLNKALLAHYYHIDHWQIPEGYLCPPIPGRADYVHYLADLLAESNVVDNKYPTGRKVRVLDIGSGANCIYPIIGSQSYGWQFVGSDIDALAIKVAGVIVQSNNCLSKQVKLLHQKDSESVFNGVIKPTDRFDLSMCNPPFHASMQEAQAGSQRKWQNLSKGRDQLHSKPAGNASVKNSRAEINQPKLNFGGQQSELWCPGGELAFVERMVKESVGFAGQVCWFTSLVSKKENIKPLTQIINRLGAQQCKVIKMSQGQKSSRLIAWSFLTHGQQQAWAEEYWC